MIAANTLNTCTAPFPSASAELRRFINRLIIIISCLSLMLGACISSSLLVVCVESAFIGSAIAPMPNVFRKNVGRDFVFRGELSLNVVVCIHVHLQF